MGWRVASTLKHKVPDESAPVYTSVGSTFSGQVLLHPIPATTVPLILTRRVPPPYCTASDLFCGNTAIPTCIDRHGVFGWHVSPHACSNRLATVTMLPMPDRNLFLCLESFPRVSEIQVQAFYLPSVVESVQSFLSGWQDASQHLSSAVYQLLVPSVPAIAVLLMALPASWQVVV